jgi:DNA (cytosine-5)-methyltransferase 1
VGILTNLSLFSGAGGLDLGAKIVGGFQTVCYVEKDEYAQGVLQSRIRGGVLDSGPIWDDVCTFNGKPWRGLVDVVSGGFPCQDLSVAGKRRGITKESRSGLWFQVARILGEVGPRGVLLENVPAITLDGNLGIVLGDLANLGFDVEWFCIPAAAVGTHFYGNRWFACGWKTNSTSHGLRRERIRANPSGAWSEQQFKGLLQHQRRMAVPAGRGQRISDGVAFRAHRLRLCGNGVVPQQAAPAWARIKEIAHAM